MSEELPQREEYEAQLADLRLRLEELREQAQQARGDREMVWAEMETILDSLPVGVLISQEVECRSIRASRVARELLRLEKGQNASQTASDRERPAFRIHAKGRELAGGELPVQRAARTGERVEGMELQVVFDGGETVDLLCNSSPVRDAQGRIRGALAAFLDIGKLKWTEDALRQSELRFRNTFDNAPTPIALSLPDGRFCEVNRAYCDLLGYTREELFEKGFIEVTHPDDRHATASDAVRRLVSGEIATYQSEKRYVHKTGRTVWCDIRVSRVLREDGTLAYFVTHLQDITQRREVEDARRESARMREQFLAILGHELRNPLAAIRHAVHLLKDLVGTGQGAGFFAQSEAFEVVDRQTLQLSRLVDDLLDIERTSQGKFELEVGSVNLGRVLRSAVSAVRGVFAGKAHGYLLEADPTLVVRGDRARLEQVFVNLLSNAAKFTDSGGEIRVSALRQGMEAVVEVKDTGCGIPESVLPRIFEAFLQADTSLDRANGGLGLGLAIVQRLVTRHGGSVSARNNEEGEGATLRVVLPLCEEECEGEKDSGVRTLGAAERLGAVPVLIVDDHVDAARLLAKLLYARGYEVHVVHDGVSAMEKAREVRPKALLMDIGLPGIDGYDLARLLRKDPAVGRSVFVAVSGYAGEEDRKRASSAGFDHHFAKPVSLESLLEVLPQTKRPPSKGWRPR
jgi:PAS domain S-box-containing protein